LPHFFLGFNPLKTADANMDFFEGKTEELLQGGRQALERKLRRQEKKYYEATAQEDQGAGAVKKAEKKQSHQMPEKTTGLNLASAPAKGRQNQAKKGVDNQKKNEAGKEGKQPAGPRGLADNSQEPKSEKDGDEKSG